MNIEKEVFELWKEISPGSGFASGLKKYAGQIWIPTHTNVKNALIKINKLEKKTKDKTIKKFLAAMRRDLMFNEPHEVPGKILNALFTHLIVDGIKDKHMTSLAEQALNFLGVQQHLWTKKWPIEIQIFTAQECDGSNALIETIKKKCKKETREALTALQKRLNIWKQNITKIKMKTNDFKETYNILQKKSKGLGRKKQYHAIIRDYYDYTETPKQIDKLAVSWITEELPNLKKIMKKLAKRYKCKPTVEEIDKALDKHQKVPVKQILKIISRLRKVLQPLAQNEWVEITPKYNVKVIETPKYLVPFLPTAAMQTFNYLTKKPFCLFFATTDTKANPATSLPDISQTIIHEEYGHCVNFMNSYTSKLRLVEILGITLDIPITEGLSFHRELEATKTIERISKLGAHNKIEREFVKEIEKHCTFEEYTEGMQFSVAQWRMVRFLRAISDVRINQETQTFPEFIEWAHKKTGLSKKMIFHQTFQFQKNPGYAPCYSVFGQKLKDLQAKAIKKGATQKEFNTYVASIGFPARSIFEQKLKQKFKL